MAPETWVQSPVESYQRLKKWYLMPPCLTLSIIRYGSRVKWHNTGKGVALSPTPWCSKLLKREPSGHPRLWSLTLLTYIYIYIYIYIWEQLEINTTNFCVVITVPTFTFEKSISYQHSTPLSYSPPLSLSLSLYLSIYRIYIYISHIYIYIYIYIYTFIKKKHKPVTKRIINLFPSCYVLCVIEKSKKHEKKLTGLLQIL